MNHLTHRQRPILVAVQLDKTDDAVLHSARYLARKLHAPLHLVHAVRPMFSYVGTGDIIVNPYYGYEMNFSDKEEQSARDKLKALGTGLDDAEVTTHLVREFPAEAILSLAEDIKPGLIVCGVDTQAALDSGFWTAMSTGFSLASEAKSPVLLVPTGKEILKWDGPLRLLVADNLEREGEAALGSALRLADELHAESLIHIHVQNMGMQDVERMIESVRESMLLGQQPSDPELNREYYLDKVKARTRTELASRYESQKQSALNSTRYECQVAFGKPADEVHKEVVRSGVQMMIFGRHHLVHRKTLSLGRIPYRSMVEAGVATLVVPELNLNPSDTAQREEDYRQMKEGDSFLNHGDGL